MLVGAHGVVDVLGLTLTDVVGLQDVLDVACTAGERRQCQEFLEFGGPVGVGPGPLLAALELLVVPGDRPRHLHSGGRAILEQLLVVHVSHHGVPRQYDVAAAQHPLIQQLAQCVPVLHMRERIEVVGLFQEGRRLGCLPGSAQCGRVVVDGVPFHAHGLGHLPGDLHLPCARSAVGEGHHAVQRPVERKPGRQQP